MFKLKLNIFSPNLEMEMPIISGGAPLAQDLISRDVS